MYVFQRFLFPVMAFITFGLFLGVQAASYQPLMVFAASSLQDVLPTIGRSFEQSHPGVRVNFNFAASGVLLQQIRHGAPADIFITADAQTMDLAEKDRLIKASSRFNWLSNSLVLVVPRSSHLPLHTLTDLTRSPIQYIAIGNPTTTPNGRYAQAALQQAGILQSVASKFVLAANARQSLDYVRRGEVQAGFVFATDARLFANDVRVAFTIPTFRASAAGWVPDPIVYPAALIQSSQHAQARSFLVWLRSPSVSTLLLEKGFLKPNP